ncbi:MAG: hypothetical protein K9G43_07770 [Rhodobacteraceae bacterium]|nr:hypothetical protein [Paracoccaceae bacterium]
MAKTSFPQTRGQTARDQRAENPLGRMMTGFTGFALAVTLILATVLPVEAHRDSCATPSDSTATCAK